jgi:hypothetical protein
MEKKINYTWQVASVNIFIMVIILSVIHGIKLNYLFLNAKAVIQTLAAIIMVNSLISCVITGILYLFSRNKKLFRVTRCLILSAWAVAFIQFYNVVRADESRDAFVQSANQSCYKAQQAGNNVAIPEKNISYYCNCIGNSFYDSLAPSDVYRLEQLAANKLPMPPEIQNKINNVSKSCVKKMISKMSPSELKQMDNLISSQNK